MSRGSSNESPAKSTKHDFSDRSQSSRKSSAMPSSSHTVPTRRDDASSETESNASPRRTSKSNRFHSRSPQRSSSHHRSASSSHSSAPPPAWYEKMISIEIENRELKRRLAKYSESRQSHHHRSPCTHLIKIIVLSLLNYAHPSSLSARSPRKSPRRSPRKHHDAKPHIPRNSIRQPKPTQDDLDFPVGVTLSEANEQAAVFWDQIRTEAVERSDGFPVAQWEDMSNNPTYLNVSHKYKPFAPYLLTPEGKGMKGFPKPCSNYAALHHVAAGIISVLFVKGPLPLEQPHLDLMGLMFEHLIPATRNSAPGQKKSRATANRLAPPHYILPGGLATAMVATYITYHTEKHRKARLNRLERARALMANGQRPPRKSAPRVPKVDPTYEFLRDESFLASGPTSSGSLEGDITNAVEDEDHREPSKSRQDSPHFDTPDPGSPSFADVETEDHPTGRRAIESPTAPHTQQQSPRTALQTYEDAARTKVKSGLTQLQPLPSPQAHSNGFVDLDEDVQDIMESSKTGGVGVNVSPVKKPKKKKKKKGEETDEEEAPPEWSKPPGYSPSEKPTKKTKKQEADAKRLATLHAVKKAKMVGIAKGTKKSKAAEEEAASSEEEILSGDHEAEQDQEGDEQPPTEPESGDEVAVTVPSKVNGTRGKAAVGVAKAKANAKATANAKAKAKAVPTAAAGTSKSVATGKKRGADEVVPQQQELPPLKRMRTCDDLDAEPVTERRTSNRRHAAVGEPTGEFNDSYWQGVELSQPLVDQWCTRLGIKPERELAKRHGQGLTTGPAKRSYLVDLCAVAQRAQRKQLDPKYDAKKSM
ncbi:hypothetical protein P7C70_g7036, partial [Phenoliferia sp. Uapishka_3]